MAPTHKHFSNNTLQDLFTRVMEKVVDNGFYNYMCCLRLKKCWDDQDGLYYLPEQKRFNPTGLMCYWAGIDAAIKFWHRTLSEVLTKMKKSLSGNFEIKKKQPAIRSTVTKVNNFQP